MKKTLLVCCLVGFLFTACQPITESSTVDLEAEKSAAKEMLGSFHSVMTVQKVDSMFTFISENALICGSDPKEFINKEEAMKHWKELEAGPEIDFLFIDETLIKMAPDGNSSTAVIQFYVPMMLPNIPLRNTYHLIKEEGKWKIFFWSSSLIPKNEDLPKIIGAMLPEDSE